MFVKVNGLSDLTREQVDELELAKNLLANARLPRSAVLRLIARYPDVDVCAYIGFDPDAD